MRLGIMQPYFMPYLGYFQLLRYVETFVVYDNVEYTKKGWINRNRILLDGRITSFTVNLSKAPDDAPIGARLISPEFRKARRRILRQITEAYRRSSNFDEAYELIEACFLFEEDNLFRFLYNSIQKLSEYLELSTRLVHSSAVGIDHTLRNKDKVLAICKNLGSTEYVNPEGGQSLYDRLEFERNGVKLRFLRQLEKPYPQLSEAFVPRLSIIDVLMNNSQCDVVRMLNDFELI